MIEVDNPWCRLPHEARKARRELFQMSTPVSTESNVLGAVLGRLAIFIGISIAVLLLLAVFVALVK